MPMSPCFCTKSPLMEPYILATVAILAHHTTLVQTGLAKRSRVSRPRRLRSAELVSNWSGRQKEGSRPQRSTCRRVEAVVVDQAESRPPLRGTSDCSGRSGRSRPPVGAGAVAQRSRQRERSLRWSGRRAEPPARVAAAGALQLFTKLKEGRVFGQSVSFLPLRHRKTEKKEVTSFSGIRRRAFKEKEVEREGVN